MPEISIVLVDDDPDECFLFSESIAEAFPTVRLTCLLSCEALLDFLENSIIPDIIFLDLAMPIQSGEECLVEIKKNRQWNGIPIVIYSTELRKEVKAKVLASGANLYVVKPSNGTDLKAMIGKVIAKLVPSP